METEIKIPHLHQFFGVWAIHGPAGDSLYAYATGIDLRLHLDGPQARVAKERASSGYGTPVTADGIAVIDIDGTLQKQESSLGGTSTVGLRKQIRAAAKNPDIRAIMLKIDSPGGTAAGTAELADEIFNARKSKPVWSFIEDLGASAAYWAASQADQIYSNASALVGSIGAYMVVRDMSKAYEDAGVKVHVVRAGDMKGMATEGTEVTPDQLAELQRMVDCINSHFLASVARGRSMDSETVKSLADGRVHSSSDAVKIGLIDSVATFEDALAQLSTSISRSTPKMSDAPERKAATITELESACHGAGSEFIVSQLKRNATLAEAQGDWVKQLAEENAKLQSQLEEANSKAEKLEKEKAEAASKPAQKTGVAPVSAAAGDGEYDDPVATWNEAIQSKMKQGMSRQKAVMAVNRENPGLREAMLAAAN